jgi:hypothetical protein
MMKKKLKSIRSLEKKAWRLYSIHRRCTEGGFSGYVTCYTCGKSMFWKEAHLGHFKHHKIDFHPDNTRIQCPGCNTYRDGKLDVYAIRLVEEIGLERVKALEVLAARFKGYSRIELNNIILEYK